MQRFHAVFVLVLAASASAHDAQHSSDHAEPAEHTAPAPPSHAAGPPAQVAPPPTARTITVPGRATPPQRVPPDWRGGTHHPQAPTGTPIDRWHRGNPQHDRAHGAGDGGDHHDHRRWNGDMHQDHHRWHGGHWWHGNVGGRGGWWWIVGPEWYWYPAPAYPEPEPDTPPGMEPGYWYWCDDFQDYYPNVRDCPSGWQQEVPDNQ